MRKITRNAINAFYAGKDFKMANTQVKAVDGVTTMLLHGNAIAKTDGKTLEIRTCGWGTPTTRERLNGLQGVSVTQRNFVQYLNGEPWENHAEWTTVN